MSGGRVFVDKLTVGGFSAYEVTSNPDGALQGDRGDLAVLADVPAPTVYQNVDGAMSWRVLGYDPRSLFSAFGSPTTTVAGLSIDLFGGGSLTAPSNGNYEAFLETTYWGVLTGVSNAAETFVEFGISVNTVTVPALNNPSMRRVTFEPELYGPGGVVQPRSVSFRTTFPLNAGDTVHGAMRKVLGGAGTSASSGQRRLALVRRG